MAMQITVEDVAELRRQGSFREFLSFQFAPDQIAERLAPAIEPEVIERDPNHRPGAWPTGTRPPEPSSVGTPEQWAHAVTAYRQWLAAGQPPGDFTCQCGCTPGARRGAR